MAQSEIMLGALPYGADIVVGEELEVGTITIDGTVYTRYVKVINTGLLPNINTKAVAHGITGAVGFLSLRGVTFRSDGMCRPLPMAFLAGATTGNIQIADIYVNDTDVYLVTNANFSTYTSSHVTIEYYK